MARGIISRILNAIGGDESFHDRSHAYKPHTETGEGRGNYEDNHGGHVYNSDTNLTAYQEYLIEAYINYGIAGAANFMGITRAGVRNQLAQAGYRLGDCDPRSWDEIVDRYNDIKAGKSTATGHAQYSSDGDIWDDDPNNW